VSRLSPGILALIASAAILACRAGPSITLRQVVSGLASPVEIVTPGDGSGRLFVLQQTGQIRIVQNGAILSQDFIDIPVVSGGERGLLGMAFHPDYASNRAFYVYYTCLFGGQLPCPSQGALTVTRFLRDAVNPNRADPTSGAVILSILHDDADNHNGGRIQFGPDGHLYIGTGDGSPGGDQERYSQNRCVLLGKILRIAVDGGTSYTIPSDNPYASSSCASGTCPEIWSYGMRNPWKFAFDRSTGDLLIGDVGQTQVEEVDFEPWSSIGGRNYGWGVYEGNNCFNDSYAFGTGAPAYCYAYNFTGSPGACDLLASHTRPVITYTHNGATGGFVITGGYRYRGANPALKGLYFYSDYSVPRIWGARPDRFGAWTTEVLLPTGSGLSSPSTFGEDDAGELYVASHLNGIIYAIDGPPLTNVVSRKTHGGAGDFDFELDVSRAIGDFVSIEPRVGASGGTSHLVVFQFSVPITSAGTPTCVDAIGNSIGTPSALFSGNEVLVTLDNLPDNQRVKVALANVNGTGIKVEASLAFLAGDVDRSGAVTSSDILRVKGRLGQPLNVEMNFLYDADLSSAVSSLDVDQVKVNAGLSLQ
jgi:hypothetical protein